MTSRPEAETATAGCCDHHDHAAVKAAEHGTIVTDPVCGMTVDTRTAEHRYELGGTVYFFCSAHCLERFKAKPDAYLNPPAGDPAVTSPAICALPEAAGQRFDACPCGRQWSQLASGQRLENGPLAKSSPGR